MKTGQVKVANFVLKIFVWAFLLTWKQCGNGRDYGLLLENCHCGSNGLYVALMKVVKRDVDDDDDGLEENGGEKGERDRQTKSTVKRGKWQDEMNVWPRLWMSEWQLLLPFCKWYKNLLFYQPFSLYFMHVNLYECIYPKDTLSHTQDYIPKSKYAARKRPFMTLCETLVIISKNIHIDNTQGTKCIFLSSKSIFVASCCCLYVMSSFLRCYLVSQKNQTKRK